MNLNPENKCAQLFNQKVEFDPTIEVMLDMQAQLQKNLAARGRALDHSTATFAEKVRDITTQWRNMNLEMAELLERLPYKEWKSYTEEQKAGFLNDEHRLETFYEFIDVFHFFMNIALDLGIDGPTFKKLYATKNAENFARQARGY
jgi:hypothetical protein